MSIKSKFPGISMELYETDKYSLQNFIETVDADEGFTEEYLILLNFADDCKLTKHIQHDLIIYLIPFYLKTVDRAVIDEKYRNKIAVDILYHFNSAMFMNKNVFKCAVGEKKYDYIMNYYIDATINNMKVIDLDMLNWVSLFNTTIALSSANIISLFSKIDKGTPQIKYSFFKYLSVLLFEEKDNLLAVNESEAFWTSNIWDFDSEFADVFFWSYDSIAYFDKEINRKKVEFIYDNAKMVLRQTYDNEIIFLLEGEMDQSFTTGLFLKRKDEFLKKIGRKTEKYRYWDKYF